MSLRYDFVRGPRLRAVLASVVAALATHAAQAQTSPQPPSGAGSPHGPDGDGHRAPPQEALDACKSVAAGKACSFTSPRGKVTGTCWAPEGKPLACKPGQQPGEGGPPPAKGG